MLWDAYHIASSGVDERNGGKDLLSGKASAQAVVLRVV